MRTPISWRLAPDIPGLAVKFIQYSDRPRYRLISNRPAVQLFNSSSLQRFGTDLFLTSYALNIRRWCAWYKAAEKGRRCPHSVAFETTPVKTDAAQTPFSK